MLEVRVVLRGIGGPAQEFAELALDQRAGKGGKSPLAIGMHGKLLQAAKEREAGKRREAKESRPVRPGGGDARERHIRRRPQSPPLRGRLNVGVKGLLLVVTRRLRL